MKRRFNATGNDRATGRRCILMFAPQTTGSREWRQTGHGYVRDVHREVGAVGELA